MAIKKPVIKIPPKPFAEPPKEELPIKEQAFPTTITEEGWVYSDIIWDKEGEPLDYMVVSPEGTRFTKSELDVAIVQQGDFSLIYADYQRTGGELSMEDWFQIGTPLRPTMEQAITGVYPDLSPAEFFEYAETDWDSFVEDMRGFTEENVELLKQLGKTKSEIDIFYGIGTPQVTGGIPLFNDWVTEKGFTPATFADDLRARGVDESLIPGMVEFQMSELRSVYEYEQNLGRWGTALGELDKIFISEPEKIPEVAVVFARSLLRLPSQVFSSIIMAIQGQGGASVVNKDWGDWVVEKAQENIAKFQQDIAKQYPNSQLMSELASLSQNLGFSVTAMGAGLVPGLLIAPFTRVGAYAAGTAASGYVAYQMTTYQIMQQYLELMDAEKQTEFGIGLTQFEEDELKKDFHDLAHKYGLWEAIPEAISNLAFFSLLTAPLSSMIGRSTATRLISKIAGIYGEELITEMITQKGQARIEVEAGLRELDIGWVEAFKEIAPQTFLLTTVMAGAGSTIISVKNRIQKAKQSLTNEIGENHPQHDELIEKIENNLDEAVITEPIVEEVTAVPKVKLPEGIKKDGLNYIVKDRESLKQLTEIEDGAIVKIGNYLIKVKFSEGTKHYENASLLSTVEDFTTGKVQDVYVRSVFLDKFLSQVREIKLEAKPPAVAKPPVKKTIQEEVESEAPPPDVEVPQGIVDKVAGMKEVRAREQVRPFRKVMIRLNLWRKIFKPMQKAEVEMQEERAKFEKKLKEVAGWVGKKIERRARVFEELENPGTVKDLTFGEKRAVTWFNEFFGEWADRLNLPEAKRIKGYITHIFEEQIRQQEEMSPEMALALEYTNPKHVFNKFIQERLGATAGLIVDPFVAAQAYESMELKVVYYEPMLQKIAGVIEDPNTVQSAKQYLRDYTRRMTGEVGKWDIALNRDIADFAEKIRGFPVFGERLYQRLTRGNPAGMLAYNMTGGLYTIFLGFKATSAIRNLSQHTLIIAKNGPKYFAEALAKTATAESRTALSKSLVMRSRKFAYTAGLDASFIGVMESKFGKMAMAMFRGADRINVRHAFLAGYYEAKAKLPNATEQELIDYGDECAADTQYLYTKMNSMALAQNATGRTLSMLTTWTENWLELTSTLVNRTPSQVFLEYEARTGEGIERSNWATSRKAILSYMIMVGLAMALDDETRIRLKEYTGIGSLKYLAGTLGGEFPALKTWGAIPKVAIGFALQDDWMFNEGMYELKAFIPGIIKQLDAVSSGEKDWMTLLFYVEGKDFKLKQLKEDWEKGWKEYEGLPAKERTQYRIDNPLIEAQRFIAGKFTTLSSDEARDEVLRLIEKHNIDPDLIGGYAKIFGADVKSELQKFEKRIGSLEKLEIDEEAEYFTTSNYVSEVNDLVGRHGRAAVMSDASPLTKFVLESQDTWGLFEDMTSEGKLLQRQQFPDLEASLYLFGKIVAFENPNSALVLLNLMDKYNIPPEAIKAFVNDPAKYDEIQSPLFELKRELFGMEEDDLKREPILRRIEAYDKDIPETHHDDYVAYYTLPAEGYDQERFLKDNEVYYNDVWLGILGNREKDFDKIPTVKFEETLVEYEGLDLGKARYDFRGENSWFDEEGVRLGRWKPYEKPTTEVIEKKEAIKKQVEKIRRKRTSGEFAEREVEFEEAMSKIEGLLEALPSEGEEVSDEDKQRLIDEIRTEFPDAFEAIMENYNVKDQSGKNLTDEGYDLMLKTQEYLRGKGEWWEDYTGGLLQSARGYRLMGTLGIPDDIKPADVTVEMANMLSEAIRKASLEVFERDATKEIAFQRNIWLRDWGVPEGEWADWEKHLVVTAPKLFTSKGKEARGLYYNESKAIAIAHSGGPDTFAHEFAHANYFENVPKAMLSLYPQAHQYAINISPIYKDIISKYPDNRGFLPVEGYATAYEKGVDKLPWFMEPFYGNLLFEVPDLPFDWEKSALAWLVFWMADKLGIK